MQNIFRLVGKPIKRVRQHILKHKLLREYGSLVRDFQRREEPEAVGQAAAYTVWVCWLQGEDAMPPLVKACYNSLLRNAGAHPVRLVTKDNYAGYATIPPYIIEKVEKGTISLTHFSDILRVCLIYEHGGLWIDSTMLVTAPLPEFTAGFYSIKHKKAGQHVSNYRWTAFLLYGAKGNLLFAFLRAFFFTYWERKTKLITYLMIDYAIAIAYETIPAIKRMIDAVPYNNLRHNDLRYLMKEGKAYNPTTFENICSLTCFHKLTWKKHFREYTHQHGLTYYGFILKEYMHE